MAVRKCKKGYECGEACISKTDRCPSKQGGEQSISLTKVSKTIKASASASTSKAEHKFFKDSELKKIAETAKSLLSAKKESRAEIAGKPNEKELKKQLLAKEEEAYAFLTIYRKNERLVNGGRETPEELDKSTKLYNLLQAMANGDKDSVKKSMALISNDIVEKRAAKTLVKVEEKPSKLIKKVSEVLNGSEFKFLLKAKTIVRT